jgi:hypothetical protein
VSNRFGVTEDRPPFWVCLMDGCRAIYDAPDMPLRTRHPALGQVNIPASVGRIMVCYLAQNQFSAERRRPGSGCLRLVAPFVQSMTR